MMVSSRSYAHDTKMTKAEMSESVVLPENMTGSGVRNRFNKANRITKREGLYISFSDKTP